MTPTIAAFLLALLLAGCATSQPYLETKTRALRPLLAAGKFDEAVRLVRNDLNFDDSNTRALRAELAQYPDTSRAVVAVLSADMQSATEAHWLDGLPKAIELTARDRLISNEQAQMLRAMLVRRFEEALRSGAIVYDLGNADLMDALPELKTPSNELRVFERTLHELPGAIGHRRELLLARAFLLARREGRQSAYDKMIRASIPSFRLRAGEIAKFVSPFDAALARELTSATAKQILVRSEPNDRLLEEDVKDLLTKRDDDVQFVTVGGAGVTILTVGKLQYEERVEPERKETITYQQHEVNLLGAVLLMPRNASYMYEYVSGGLDVNAAYLIKVSKGSDVIVDRVLRERASGRYNTCQNARIVNVFGGVQKAEFVANDDMTRRCGGSAMRPDPNEIRAAILAKVADEIAVHLRK